MSKYFHGFSFLTIINEIASNTKLGRRVQRSAGAPGWAAFRLEPYPKPIEERSFPAQTRRVAIGIRIAGGIEYPGILIDIEHDRRGRESSSCALWLTLLLMANDPACLKVRVRSGLGSNESW